MMPKSIIGITLPSAQLAKMDEAIKYIAEAVELGKGCQTLMLNLELDIVALSVPLKVRISTNQNLYKIYTHNLLNPQKQLNYRPIVISYD
jgi:hypothetical protein